MFKKVTVLLYVVIAFSTAVIATAGNNEAVLNEDHVASVNAIASESVQMQANNKAIVTVENSSTRLADNSETGFMPANWLLLVGLLGFVALSNRRGV